MFRTRGQLKLSSGVRQTLKRGNPAGPALKSSSPHAAILTPQRPILPSTTQIIARTSTPRTTKVLYQHHYHYIYTITTHTTNVCFYPRQHPLLQTDHHHYRHATTTHPKLILPPASPHTTKHTQTHHHNHICTTTTHTKTSPLSHNMPIRCGKLKIL